MTRSPLPSRLLTREERRVIVDALHFAAAATRKTRAAAQEAAGTAVWAKMAGHQRAHVDALSVRAATQDRLAAEITSNELELKREPSS